MNPSQKNKRSRKGQEFKKKNPPTFFRKRRFKSVEKTAINTTLINVKKTGILFIWNFYMQHDR